MDIDKQLRASRRRLDRVNAVKQLQTAILANGCYSDKEEKLQFDKANALGNLTDNEASVIRAAWNFRKTETALLADELKIILKEWKDEKRSKKNGN